MARKVRLSPAQARALRAMADADTRIDYMRHRRQWITVQGRVVAGTTMRSLQARGYVKPTGRQSRARPLRMRSRQLTALAKDWLKDGDD